MERLNAISNEIKKDYTKSPSTCVEGHKSHNMVISDEIRKDNPKSLFNMNTSEGRR